MELMCWFESVCLFNALLYDVSWNSCSSSNHLCIQIPGGLLGESFIVRQMLPLLKHVVRSCIDISRMHKPEPVQSWSAFALIDCLMTIDGLVAFLSREVVVKELIEVWNLNLILI